MMCRRGQFRYGVLEDLRILVLPYGKKDISLFILCQGNRWIERSGSEFE